MVILFLRIIDVHLKLSKWNYGLYAPTIENGSVHNYGKFIFILHPMIPGRKKALEIDLAKYSEWTNFFCSLIQNVLSNRWKSGKHMFRRICDQ